MPGHAPQFEDLTEGLLVRAPAKINLTLLVAGKRPDGYHEIDTVMAKVNLYDEIRIERGALPGIELVCMGAYEVPCGQENLVWKACWKWLKMAGRKQDLRITLVKNIPPGSGLGGGSSDAAAVLLGLNRFDPPGLSREQLFEVGASLGSDICFFFAGPAARCTGRGEEINEITGIFRFPAILVLPDLNVSTKRVYENYVHDPQRYQNERRRMESLLTSNDLDSLGRVCTNMLESSCFELYPELADLKSRIEALGLGRVCLSGSGSAMYCMTDDQEENTERSQTALEESVGCKCIRVYSNRW